jgi:gamma-butyrobetaine dioxygenase
LNCDHVKMEETRALGRIQALYSESRYLSVTWQDGHVSRFDWIWLRDNCCCRDCVHPKTGERTFDLLSVPLDIRATEIAAGADGEAVQITWPDQHQSWFSCEWLRQRCYCEDHRASGRQHPRTIWDATYEAQLPTAECEQLSRDDAAFLKWCKELCRFGVTLVRGVSTNAGRVVAFGSRIGHVWNHKYGSHFDVVAMENPDSTAYTELALPLHTDLPSRRGQPGFQFLHCLVHAARGGESIFVDGFRVAEILRAEDPEAFELLATEEVEYRFFNEGGDYRFRSEVLKLNPRGELVEIRFNPFLLQPLDLQSGKVRDYYRAWRKFHSLTNERGLQIRLTLRAGDLIAFDNHRILHARTAIDVRSGERHLQGCYLERDEIYSRIRMLERSLASQKKSLNAVA